MLERLSSPTGVISFSFSFVYPQNPFYFSHFMLCLYTIMPFFMAAFEYREWNEKTIRHNIFFEGVVNENVRDLF